MNLSQIAKHRNEKNLSYKERGRQSSFRCKASSFFPGIEKGVGD
jgi:hypothetical protein